MWLYPVSCFIFSLLISFAMFKAVYANKPIFVPLLILWTAALLIVAATLSSSTLGQESVIAYVFAMFLGGMLSCMVKSSNRQNLS